MSILQNADPGIGPVKTLFKENQKPSKDVTTERSPESRHYVMMWEQLHLDDDVLYLKVPLDGVSNKRLLVATLVRSNLFIKMLSLPSCSHFSVLCSRKSGLQSANIISALR
ncbi:hypothetical protein DPMN_165571 [Dreissena polymorpha]|uniref:Uncharacterized protein n=1 Tax=Dreissena polymorpha TaxID=45954 RepID=A0A9D4IWR0_DREPO|nr:hypothetical protein DPMN_165571 [Dreissena polymorpha]